MCVYIYIYIYIYIYRERAKDKEINREKYIELICCIFILL